MASLTAIPIKNHPAAKEKLPWLFRTSTIVIAVCCVGPLGLPLIWWRPKLRIVWKIVWTIAVLLLSWVLYQTTLQSVEVIQEYYELMNSF